MNYTKLKLKFKREKNTENVNTYNLSSRTRRIAFDPELNCNVCRVDQTAMNTPVLNARTVLEAISFS